MAADRVTITQKSNGDWVVRHNNRSTNHGKGAAGRAHAQRQVRDLARNKYARRDKQRRRNPRNGTTQR